MIKDTIIAGLAAFALSLVLTKLGIPVLHRLKFGQYIREEGPKDHQKKSGTPTMGGIMFLIAASAVSACYAPKYPKIIPVAAFMLLFGLIGFTDDYIKVVKKHNEGLKPGQKLAMQIAVTAAFAVYLFMHPDISTDMLVPFTGDFESGLYLKLGWLFIPAVFIIVLGTDNGVNLTDGLDGLCTSVTIIVAIFFAAVTIRCDIPMAPIGGITAGALMGFLMYNAYPARVFMGDTGSLALGGFVSSFALMTGMPLFIVPVGIIYLTEAVSVIMQVSYFKATHGKRIFRMAPIHHHFELGGMSETRIVAVFTAVTVIASLLAFIGFC